MHGEGAPLEPLEQRAAEKGSEDDVYWRAAALRAGAGGGKGGGDADSEPLLPAGSVPSLGAIFSPVPWSHLEPLSASPRAHPR